MRTSTLPGRGCGTGTSFRASSPPSPVRRQAFMRVGVMVEASRFRRLALLRLAAFRAILNPPYFLLNRPKSTHGPALRCVFPAQGTERAVGAAGGDRALGDALP